jgi:peptidoglycan/LPS O-acetylase OafA/YrhL
VHTQQDRGFVNLDFMRSVAVLCVVASHCLIYLGRQAAAGWSGITGVSMFFVHTTLVLMWSLEREPHIGRFYLRRAFRIYPLWWVVLALTLLTHLPMSPLFAPGFGFFQPNFHELVQNILLTFNFGPGARVVGASWTLPLEVQMYLLLPFLFLVAQRTKRLWPLLLLEALVIAYDLKKFPAIDPSLRMCIPLFVPGVMTYVLKKRSLPKLPSWAFPVFLLTLVAIDHPYGSFRRSWLFSLVLGLSLPFFRDMRARPVRVVSELIARYSYGIYLLHMAAIGVAFHVLRAYSAPVRLTAFLLLLVAAPVLFYHLVEAPMIRLGARLARRLGHGRMTLLSRRDMELEMAP